MKSALLLSALAATALSAALPVAQEPADAAPAPESAVPESEYDALVDMSVQPFVNYVDAEIEGIDPAQFLAEADPSTAEDDAKLITLEGGPAAWALIEAEVTDVEGGLNSLESRDVDASRRPPPPPPPPSPVDLGTSPWVGKRQFVPGGGAWQPYPYGPGGPNDFHFGITAEQLCTYFTGIAWKTQELRRPVFQWQAENVPWLIQNAGPYTYVLDNLRKIEWVLWKIERALDYVSAFTDDEERAITRCYYAFSGYERQLTTIPGQGNNNQGPFPGFGGPGPVIPGGPGGPVVGPVGGGNPPANAPGPLGARDLETLEAREPEAQPQAVPPTGGVVGGFWPGGNNVFVRIPIVFGPNFPYFRRFTFKDLLRLIRARAPVSRYQSYANHRIVNVLENLERSSIGAGRGLIRKFQTKRYRDFLLFDLQRGQGLRKVFADAIQAFRST